MRTYEQQLRQVEAVLDQTEEAFLQLDTPEVAVAIVMTLLETFIEAHPDQEQKTLEILMAGIAVRDRVIQLYGMILKNAEGIN